MEQKDQVMDDSEHQQDQHKDQAESEVIESKDSTGSGLLAAATKKLADLGYYVLQSEEDGQHRFLQTGSNDKFKFVDQKHYDKLGDFLCDWIQGLMVDKFKMRKIHVPFEKDLTEGAAQTPIFISEDWETNTERALVLIQGTGDVRSGYWARSVCMNDTLELGSMIPDIEFAQSNGFSVLVMNPNYSADEKGVRVDKLIRGMNHHSTYVWDNLVENGACPAKEIYMVAHSAGGGCAHEIIVEHPKTMVDRVRAIALTDACHGRFYAELNKEGKRWAEVSCRAYDASKKDLDEPLNNSYKKPDFPELSAGHFKHVYTTGCARPSYLNWFVSRSLSLNAEE